MAIIPTRVTASGCSHQGGCCPHWGGHTGVAALGWLLLGGRAGVDVVPSRVAALGWLHQDGHIGVAVVPTGVATLGQQHQVGNPCHSEEW